MLLLFFLNGSWIIKSFDKRYGTFVNNEQVSSKKLFNGDVIFIMGLKIIIMGNRLFVNNPFDKMHYDSHTFTLKSTQNENLELKPENENGEELYSEEEYFSRSPRLINEIEHVKVKVDPPPQKQEKEQIPLLYLLVPMMAMGMMSAIMVFNSISSVLNGTGTWTAAITQIFMATRNVGGYVANANIK